MDCGDSLRSEKGNPTMKPNLICLLGLVVMLLLAAASSDTGTGVTSVTPTPDVNPSVRPASEGEFISAVATAQRGSPQAENDMQRGGIKATRDEGICRVLVPVNFRAQDWIGTVTKVDSNSDGKGVLAVSISKDVRLQTWNNDLSDIDDNTLIQPRTELFQTASLLKVGQLVSFSGSFIPEREDCIEESSMTLRGKLDDPEFVFRFSSVSPYTPTMPASRAERPKEEQQRTGGTDAGVPSTVAQPGQCLSYAPAAVTLVGALTSKTFPGRPNYESVEKGDEPETYWILSIAQPICTNQSQDGSHEAAHDVSALQLLFTKSEMYQTYRSLLDTNVKVTGSLFSAETAHHHTPVMLQVASMESVQVP